MTAQMAMQWDAVLVVGERVRGRGEGQGAGWSDGCGGWDGLVAPTLGLLTAGAGRTVDQEKETIYVSFYEQECDLMRPARACLLLMGVRK